MSAFLLNERNVRDLQMDSSTRQACPIYPKKYNWFVGLTDGDGTFSFSLNKKEKFQWNCTFKIGASIRNARLLRYCHQLIGCGGVNMRAGKAGAEFRIRDRKLLRTYILPLFEKYPLYTTKAFYYFRWKRALDILESNRPSHEKHTLLESLRKEEPAADYKAPAWEKGVPAKEWLSGFVEAEGSFYICNKGGAQDERLVHAFGCTQKLDEIVLQWMRKRFHIPAQVLLRSPKSRAGSYYKLESTNARALSRMRPFFKDQFYGRKRLEFRIWERSLKWRGQNNRLREIRELLRNLRALQGTFPDEIVCLSS